MNPIDNWTPEIVAAIKRTCVPGGALPPDAEFSMFLAYCKSTGLNPVAKEAYLNERRSKDYAGNWHASWQIMVSRDGYLSAAHRSGLFAGMETYVFPEDPTSRPTHATCKVWRKDWERPIVLTVSFSEYVELNKEGKPTRTWAEKPRTMIGKVAESQALRRAFGLHGSYSEEELPDDAAGQVSEPQSPALSGDSPAPALPAPAFKDVLGAKLAEARGKPQLAVVKTHDEDGLPVHPEDREDGPLPAFDPKTGEILERDPELPPEQVQTQEQLVTEVMGMLKTVAQKRSKKGDKLSALVSELTVKIWGFEVTPDLLRETLTAIERHRLVDGLLALEQEVQHS